MNVEATFVASATAAADFPGDGLPEVALVGRSNVGKSSLINALVRQRLARTSAAPGKTRLANVYRVTRNGGAPVYLVDLPGYGYARGDARELAQVTQAYFGRVGQVGLVRQGGRPALAALLIIDSRHPGLENDLEAWRWIQPAVQHRGLVAVKIDKLARGERIRALREIESVFEDAVLPVSAVTGEGLDELWKLIDRLTKSG
ncbi:MAG: ribosome biogenesis GTP-binding protein YsxC [Acidobacteria bacterium]|nr:ribosome biogenesis GTP-binding protein YsxC [Acidobacteriota bacterium]